MRAFVIAGLVAGCGSPSAKPMVLGQPPSEWIEPGTVKTKSVQRFFAEHSEHWAIDMDPVLQTPRSIRGPGESWASSKHTLESAARSFIKEHVDLFGTDEFVFAGQVLDADVWTIQLAQQYRGLPVIGGHLGFTAVKEQLVLVQGVTYRIRDLDPAPSVQLAEAIAMTRSVLEAPHTGDRDSARLVVLPQRAPGAVAYRLAWEVSAWREEQHVVAFVDAHDGRVLDAYDANRYEYAGKATHDVDQRTVGDEVVTLPAGFMRLNSTHGTTITDGDGAFRFGGRAGLVANPSPLLVTANLRGSFVDVRNLGGEDATFVGMMRPDRAYALEWNEARSTPEEVDVFRAVNETNRFVATVFPDIEWMKQPLLAKVNHKQTCNAYWNGSSINFFREGGGCNNTGRIFDVVAHEWGHGLDQNAPGGAVDGALGEFIGDLLSFVQTHSPLLGPNFLTNGDPARDLEDPDFQCFDPKKREVHDAGHLLGALIWDVHEDLKKAGVTGEPLKRLMVLPIAIAQTRSQWYGAMLAVDDNDGDLANGTPNECLIYNQYKAHSCAGTRWPGMPDEDPEHCRN